MCKKLLFSLCITLTLIMSLFASPDNIDKNAIEKAFTGYKASVESENYEKAWSYYSEDYHNKNKYDDFKIDFNDEDRRDVISGLKVEDINSQNGNIILKSKMSGFWGLFSKRKFYFEFVFEKEMWKINDIYLSSMSRTPSRGYHPEDFSHLSNDIHQNIIAIQNLCMKFTKGLATQDFRNVWECYSNQYRPSYDKFLNYNFVQGAKNNISVRESWNLYVVREIKISGEEATVDTGSKGEKEVVLIFVLINEQDKWKIKHWYDITSLGFDEDDLPSFYFVQQE